MLASSFSLDLHRMCLFNKFKQKKREKKGKHGLGTNTIDFCNCF
jgi:hypothetical protein